MARQTASGSHASSNALTPTMYDQSMILLALDTRGLVPGTCWTALAGSIEAWQLAGSCQHSCE
eukprot:CAMPEP_0202900344 /NCGR_PEP_ID=MMETSP1392-20130828/11170_1 /ASSEMBLY_ACC=CAM_ASM_000868 /TAXON_ID=225041 /ORGANISM="Chlamydomonas chlamydogama, Strain SAG 11-48b" /LENGTH=62 /DNA_ID=CAMNT_0049586717 /DNA_START=741 /DNA_END=929 /DNA_ORIENTATION=-